MEKSLKLDKWLFAKKLPKYDNIFETAKKNLNLF